MELKKELTIKEIFDEMAFLKSKLIRLAEKYNRSLITVSAVTWKDIITSGGKKGDIMLNRTIKKDKIHDEFDIVKESYDSYKAEAIDKIKDMLSKKSTGYCIVYFRDQLKWKWKDICKLFNYSLRQCHNLYSKEKSAHNCTQLHID